MLTQAPKGTQDVLPQDSYRWQAIEENMRRIASLAGYREVRTPMFEHTELFQRGVGDTTDVVQKEMYTFNDKGGRSITLKPEIVDPEAIEDLQDLIVSGVNEVLRKVEEETETRMNEISGGLNIPGLY